MNLIVALRALLHERNVTRAAKAVGLGQSSMSHALASLREHFADPLLVKSGRSLVLTERGQSLIEPVNLAVTHLERVFVGKQSFDPKTSERSFRIVGTDSLELYLLPQLAALLAREAPRVLVRFHHLQSGWAEALKNGEADLKLGRKYELVPGCRSEDLLEEELVCVVRKDHPLVGERLTLKQYAALSHVAITPTLSLTDHFTSFVEDLLAQQRLKRHVAATVSHFLVAPFVVANTDLLLTAPERLARTFARSLKLRLVPLPLSLTSYKLTQVWAERADADPGHLWLRRAVTRALAK